jgi:hypothetical protein
VALLFVGLAGVALAADAVPLDPLRWGLDLRLRNEYFDNALTLDDTAARHEQNYQRYRARLWSSADLNPSFTVNSRFVWESWEWDYPSYKAPNRDGWTWSDGMIDQLNVTWKSSGKTPVQIVAGRQDIVLGDGWLVLDGTSTDGSRTTYFDALRITVPLPGIKSTVDCAYIDLEAYNENRLPAFNDQHKPMSEQDEHSAYLQFTNKSLANLMLESYLIFRDETRVVAAGDDGHITTWGVRSVYDPTPHWQLKGEAALQWGKLDTKDVQAWGFLGQLAWNAKDTAGNQLRLALECLSGDDPGTARNEQFDITWGRYPRWSEIYALLYVPETRVAQYGNLVRFGPGWSVAPIKPVSVSLDYNALWAMENNRGTASGLFRSSGNFRGHLVRSMVKYNINPHLTATTLCEVLKPGNYYGPTKQGAAIFWRVELLFVF